MNKKTIGIIGAGAAAAALTLGAVTMATAADENTASPNPAVSGSAVPGDGMHGMGGPGAGETPLTGEEAEKVTAAAQAEIPDGTVLRVETDADGTYEAHVRKADGTEVEVKMDKDFKVTSVEEHSYGHGPMDDDDSATATPSA